MTSLAGGTQGVNKELPSRVVLVTNFLETCSGLNSGVTSTWGYVNWPLPCPSLAEMGPGQPNSQWRALAASCPSILVQ